VICFLTFSTDLEASVRDVQGNVGEGLAAAETAILPRQRDGAVFSQRAQAEAASLRVHPAGTGPL